VVNYFMEETSQAHAQANDGLSRTGKFEDP